MTVEDATPTGSSTAADAIDAATVALAGPVRAGGAARHAPLGTRRRTTATTCRARPIVGESSPLAPPIAVGVGTRRR